MVVIAVTSNLAALKKLECNVTFLSLVPPENCGKKIAQFLGGGDALN